MKVWCVWTESGAYETYSRDLRGIFATRELAEAHLAQLVSVDPEYDGDAGSVAEEDVLAELPVRVSYVIYKAHIRPDGSEDTGLGYARGSNFQTWSNELAPLATGEIKKWTGIYDPRPDLLVEVRGSDEALVAAEYARLLAEARDKLGAKSA